MRECSALACLPSLRPILTSVSEKLALLRKRKSQHRKGPELLMDMLPRDKQARPILPFTRAKVNASSITRGVLSLIYDRTVREMEAIEQSRPEMEGVNRFRPEMEAAQTRWEMQAGRVRLPVELEAGSTSVELEVRPLRWQDRRRFI